MISTQPSKLLAQLFKHIEEDQRVEVLHIGPALPETVDFFSHFRCKLHFVDLFSELPFTQPDDSDDEPCISLEQQFAEQLDLPPETKLDICLFWDLFNFLESDAIAAFLAALQPHLHSGSFAHGFTAHNLTAPQDGQIYGIRELDALSVRHRQQALPGYTPHGQTQLQNLIDCFSFDHSVLLPDSRLEVLLRARL